MTFTIKPPGDTVNGKFVLDKAAIGKFAKTDPGLIRAVDALARDIRKEIQLPRGERPAFIAHYTTDRHVAGIVVKAIQQARHGAITKALGRLGRRVKHAPR